MKRVDGKFCRTHSGVSKKKIVFAALNLHRGNIRKILFSAVAAAVIVLCGSGAKNESANTVETFAVPMSGKVIVIDPGHGGIDAGASANGAVEKDLNLKISFMLQKYIEESGGIAVLTRTDDVNTADPNRGRGVSQKSSDLKERKKDIEDYDADMFISIHMNKFGQTQYKGAQVFYSEGSEDSKILGEEMQGALRETLDRENRRSAKTGGNIFVLKGNTIPSVLIECGFLSNKEEAQMLSDEKYQRRTAWAIYVGMVRYFSK